MAKRKVLNICELCKGYVTSDDVTQCPVCGSDMVFKSLDLKTIASYKLLDAPIEDTDNEDFAADQSFDNSEDAFSDDSIDITPKQRVTEKKPLIALPTGSDETFTGIVYNYKNSDSDQSKYSRLSVIKLWDAIMYRQRMEDVLHYFRLHVGSGKDEEGLELSRNINVNVHGTIVGGSHIQDNSKLTVSGKFKNGVLMASDILDEENGSHIKFRRSYKAIASAIIFAFLFIYGLIYAIVYGKAFGGAGKSIGVLFRTFGITFVIVLVLYLIVSITKLGIVLRIVSQRKMTVPWIALVIVAFAISIFVFSHLAGASNALGNFTGSISQVLSTIVLYGIIIFGLFLVIKAMIK